MYPCRLSPLAARRARIALVAAHLAVDALPPVLGTVGHLALEGEQPSVEEPGRNVALRPGQAAFPTYAPFATMS